MTLVAAYKSVGGVPMLLGDILLTAENVGPCGVEKKVHRINDQFVVGWTGFRDAAHRIVTDLYHAFSSKPCSSDDVVKFLGTYPTNALIDPHQDVTLVGWVTDVPTRKGFCFSWDSRQPNDFHCRSPLIAGSGADIFREILAEERAPATSPDPVLEATKEALHQMTDLQMDEFCGERYQKQHGFGGAYEALIHTGQRFEYADDVVFMAMDFDYDVVNDRYEVTVPHKAYKYKNFGEFSIVRIVEKGQPLSCAICEAIYEPASQWHQRLASLGPLHKALPLDSRYYCTFIRFTSSDGIAKHCSYITDDTQPDIFITEKEHQVTHGIAPGFVKRLYEWMRKESAA